MDGIVVRDWRTGAVVSSAPVPEGVDSTALRPDGRAAVTTRDGSLYEVRVDSKRFPGDPRFGVKSGPNGVMRRCG